MEKIKNKERVFGANPTYYYDNIKGGHHLFTDNQVNTAFERALDNPEDINYIKQKKMKKTITIFIIAELLAIITLIWVLDWSNNLTENIAIMFAVSGFIWGIYERYGKLQAEREVKVMTKNLNKYRGRD